MDDADSKAARVEERLEGARSTVGLFLGPVLFLVVLFAPLPGLSAEAHRLAAILALVLVYWVCEPVPIPVTALLGAALCVLLRVEDAKAVLAPFADPIVFLFIGSFIIANAMTRHRLDRRFALGILSRKWVGSSSARLLFAYGAIAALLSMWVSNTAATAMLLPIGVGILHTLGEGIGGSAAGKPDVRRWRFSSGMVLMVAYAASVGGIATPIGSPPNLITIGMLEELAGRRIAFFEWMSLATPIALAMYLLLYVLILRMHRPEVAQLSGVAEHVAAKREELGRWSAGQRNALAAFLVAVTLWVAPGVLALAWGVQSPVFRSYSASFQEGVVAILAASLLFFLPIDWRKRRATLNWAEAQQIDWGTILLFGGGLTLGGLMFKTGLATAIGEGLMGELGAHSLWGITAVAVGLGIVISETTSNTASASMVVPVVIALAKAAGVSAMPPALGACFGASYGFMLPVSTPPNAIAYSSGMVTITRMVKTGVVFDVCGFFLILGSLRVLCPLLGMM